MKLISDIEKEIKKLEEKLENEKEDFEYNNGRIYSMQDTIANLTEENEELEISIKEKQLKLETMKKEKENLESKYVPISGQITFDGQNFGIIL